MRLKNSLPQKQKNVFSNLNPNNILITKNAVEKILKIGNVFEEVDDLGVWQRAFVHKSYVSRKLCENQKSQKIKIVPLQPKSNEVYEWLGDASLESVISNYLYKRYGEKQNEGFLTKLRSKIVRTNNLSYLAKKIGLPKYLLISHHVEFSCEGRINDRILENTFEAFIGAMTIFFENKYNENSAYRIVKKFVVTIIEKFVDIVDMITKDNNSKDQLMWYFQKKFSGKHPIYVEEKYENDNFHMIIYEPGTKKIVGSGFARSKKKAEQNAAKCAIDYYLQKLQKKIN